VRPQQAFEVARGHQRLRFLHPPAAAPAPVR
jgi:hypothetical protein